jgi:hypothetical protein
MTLNSNQFGEQHLPLDWEALDRENRRDAVRGHKVRHILNNTDDTGIESQTFLNPAEHKERVDEALVTSSIPTNLLYKLAGQVETSDSLDQRSGGYNSRDDKVLLGRMDTQSSERLQEVLTHELGHKLDYTPPGKGQRFRATTSPLASAHFKNGTPDVRTEGFADGFRDRYSSPESSTNTEALAHRTGYGYRSTITPGSLNTSHPYGWSPSEQLIYHATRAHAAATGERLPIDQPGPTEVSPETAVGEHLHKLTSLSPEVGPALKNLGLWDKAQEHIALYLKRQPKVTQLSFEGDNDKVGTYIPPTHLKD